MKIEVESHYWFFFKTQKTTSHHRVRGRQPPVSFFTLTVSCLCRDCLRLKWIARNWVYMHHTFYIKLFIFLLLYLLKNKHIKVFINVLIILLDIEFVLKWFPLNEDIFQNMLEHSPLFSRFLYIQNILCISK